MAELTDLDGQDYPPHLLLPLSADVVSADSTDQELSADECYIRESERPALPPDPFQFDGVLRKGLGRRTYWEQLDVARQYWLSQDDEHWRSIIDRDLRQHPWLVSDEPEPDSF